MPCVHKSKAITNDSIEATMFDLLGTIFDFFVTLWMADKRRDARRFTVGCFFMVVIFVGLLALIFWNVDTGPPR